MSNGYHQGEICVNVFMKRLVCPSSFLLHKAMHHNHEPYSETFTGIYSKISFGFFWGKFYLYRIMISLFWDILHQISLLENLIHRLDKDYTLGRISFRSFRFLSDSQFSFFYSIIGFYQYSIQMIAISLHYFLYSFIFIVHIFFFISTSLYTNYNVLYHTT